jgi:phage-related protein
VLLENLPLIVNAGIQLLVGIINGLLQALPQLIAMLPQIITTIVTTLTSNLPKILQMGGKILVELGKGILSMIGTILSNVGTVISKIINKFLELPKKIVDVGKNLVKGLWNGINDTVGWVLDKIKGFGKSVLNGIKKIFGINSPSKLMEDEVGTFLAQGIGVGFQDEMKNVSKQMQDSIPNSFDVNSAINGVNGEGASGAMTYNNLVSAFKTALSEMKVEMDGEEMGTFVDKTVTRLIYT